MIFIINLYTSPTCSKCKILKNYMIEQKISFNEIDITLDEKGLNKLKENKLYQLPIIEINNKLIPFHNLGEIRKILEEKGERNV